MYNILDSTEKEINFELLEIYFKNVLEYFQKAYLKMSRDMPILYEREDNINDSLYAYLVDLLEEEGIETFCIIPQSYDPRQRATHGRASQVDFLVRWSVSEKNTKYQFYIECKLLNCNGKNREYINNGIRRFETNFYAKHLPFAAMIGYIERGEVPTIVSDLNRKIDDIVPNTISKIDDFYESIHTRDEGNQNIKLYHIFFDFRDCQENPFNVRPCPNNRGINSPL